MYEYIYIYVYMYIYICIHICIFIYVCVCVCVCVCVWWEVFFPFSEPNNEINYIHSESNHPPSIIKQVVHFSVELRLSIFWLSEKIFDKSIYAYQEALKKSGVYYKLKHQKYTLKQHQNNNAEEKSNLSYSLNISLNLGRYFLNLIKKNTFQRAIRFPKYSTEIIWKSLQLYAKHEINIQNKTLTNPQLSTQAGIWNWNCTWELEWFLPR